MPVRTRATNGRFETVTNSTALVKKQDIEDSAVSLPVKKENIWSIVKFVILILLISPWLFVFMKKKNTLENVSKTISEFYDDNFSCNSICKCDAASNVTNINNF